MDELDNLYAASDIVFAAKVASYDDTPPNIDFDGDIFKDVTYSVLKLYKGAAPPTVTVQQLAPIPPSPLVDEQRRLRREVFGAGRTLVIFARRDGSVLRARTGVIAATQSAILRLIALGN